ARQQMERDLETCLHLQPAIVEPRTSNAEPRTTAVFRVYRGSFEVPGALSIVGADTQLGSLVPNATLMHDDGKDGDERAGDGVWSLTASFAPGSRVVYMYTNSGARGRWEGLDVPHIRHVIMPASPDGGTVIDAERPEQFARALLRIRRRNVMDVQRGEADVLNRGQMLEEAMELEHHADFSPKRCERRRRRGTGTEHDAVDVDASALEGF